MDGFERSWRASAKATASSLPRRTIAPALLPLFISAQSSVGRTVLGLV
jgi:hypothetical protein